MKPMKGLKNVKNPQRFTDMCPHCKDYERKVLPLALAKVKVIRGRLEKLVPNYFATQPLAAGGAGVVLNLASLQALVRWLKDKSKAKEDLWRPLVAEKGEGVPFDLHKFESAGVSSLQPFVDLAETYEHHRVAAKRQLASLKPLLTKALPKRHAAIFSDYKQQKTLPLGNVQVADDFFAPARKEVSVFGSIISQWVGESFVKEKHLYLSEVIEHTPCITNKLTRAQLETLREPTDMVHFGSDCGNHFRSYENLKFTAVDVPKEFNTDTRTSIFCEKHGKFDYDRLFGEMERAIEAYLDMPNSSINTIQQLYAILVEHFKSKIGYKVHIWSPGEFTPDESTWLKFKKNYYITRSYCMESRRNPVFQHGVELCNFVFDDSATFVRVSADIGSQKGLKRPYKINRPEGTMWVDQKVPLHGNTEMRRRFLAQQSYTPADGVLPPVWKSPEQRLKEKVNALTAAAEQRVAKRIEAAAPAPAAASDQSSGSSSGSSDGGGVSSGSSTDSSDSEK